MEPLSVSILADGPLGAAVAAAVEADGWNRPPIVATTALAGLDGEPSPDLLIVALEGVSFGELVGLAGDLDARRQASMLVTLEGSSAVVGPVTVPGLTACVECRLRKGVDQQGGHPDAWDALLRQGTGRHRDVGRGVEEAVGRVVADTVRHLQDASQGGSPFSRVAICESGSVGWAVVLPDWRCSTCASATLPAGRLTAGARVELAKALEHEGFDAERVHTTGDVEHPDSYRTVGILGGGTAGYLAALVLRARLPHLEVTLIESSRIPIISVGEATTPEMVKLLHAPAFLGCDIVDFHRRVRPTFKLGIQFLWGAPSEGHFNYPFQYAPLGDPMHFDSHLDGQSVASLLMDGDRVPLVDDGEGGARSLLEFVRFAYHLDNVRFVQYLTEEARRRGIRHVDATVASAVTTSDGEEIDHLVTDTGEELRFDLYIDASGFHSVLLEGALGSPFVSYADSLFTDRAIVADAPHDGTVKPYTRAHTFESGWCWTIPFEEADHLGYVYSSAFSDEEQAVAEMRRHHPEMGDHRLVSFRSGRHGHFFRGNVVAIGNAYGFVEPLESTALHMVIYELEHLVNHFPLRTDVATKARLTTQMNDLWDQLRWFLAIHYRFNRRLDSEFWATVRATVDVSGAAERLALFGERAPLSDRPSLFYSLVPPDFFASDHAFDTLLLGQQVTRHSAPPRQSDGRWRQRVALRQSIVEGAMPQSRALRLLRTEQPDLLRRFVHDPESWLHQWIPR